MSKEEELRNNIILYKRRIERYLSDLDTLKELTESVPDNPPAKPLFLAKLAAAHESIEAFNSNWDKIEACHIKLNALDEFPDENEASMRSDFFKIIHNADAVKIHLESDKAPPKDLNSTTLIEAQTVKASLPKISLPTFSGELEKWAQFRDTFKSLVHDEPSLKPIEKYHYLLSSLSGEALSHVAHLKPNDKTYDLAWTALNKVYDNNRVLAHAFLEKIMSFHFLKSNTASSNFMGFINNVADSISAFQALNLEHPDDVILSFLALRTLDQSTRHKFELDQIGKEFPSVKDLVGFIRNGYQAFRLSSVEDSRDQGSPSISFKSPRQLNSKPPFRSSRRYDPVLVSRGDRSPTSPPLQMSQGPSKQRDGPHQNQKPQSLQHSSKDSSSSQRCSFCSGQHELLRCVSFSQISPEERQTFISKWKGCHNCLRSSHQTRDCYSKVSCRHCQKRHHTMVHLDTPKSLEERSSRHEPSTSVNHALEPKVFCAAYSSPNDQVILGTALVLVQDVKNNLHPVRALLDSGSTRSFITLSCARRLKLPVHRTSTTISSLGGNTSVSILGRIQCNLISRLNHQVNLPLNALVLPQITKALPSCQVPQNIIKIFSPFNLADPDFGIPGDIDLLLGSDVWNFIISGTPQQVQPGVPFITPTIFGDVVSGSISNLSSDDNVSFFASSQVDIQEQLKTFWQLEEPLPVSLTSPEDAYCEQHFKETYSRTPSGRFMVRFPFKFTPNVGDNRLQAHKRLYHLERKLSHNPELHREYSSFLQLYEELGHMSVTNERSSYLIPHHAVRKDQKLRVVFDGSCTSSTTSLNDQLLAGPKLQADVGDILLRFRFHAVAIVTDIVKMYRQILIHPTERKYQHIIWREHPNDDIKEYALNTVTYGLRSSAFQAIRSVRELANQEAQEFPMASKCIQRDMFVDDMVTGARSVAEAKELCSQLVQCFDRGGFSLDKWKTNFPEVLPSDISSTSSKASIEPEETPSVKVLGLVWDPLNDSFTYSINSPSTVLTKRSVLSTIARIFDPLGFLSPVVLSAKSFLQQLWLLHLDWDTPLPLPFQQHWSEFISHWDVLSTITIPRHISYLDTVSSDLIGFCDASAKAYSAVFYLRTEHSSGEISVQLLKAKTKVAPVKFHSIARLELCGALLLTRLYTSLCFDPFPVPTRTHFFTDSAVVLAWLRTPCHMLTTFEANRVSAIKEKTDIHNWSHVRSQQNPADVSSRGINPPDMPHNHLWWQGPTWLISDPQEWPTDRLASSEEVTEPSHLVSTTPSEPEWLLRLSSLRTLLHTVARILRLRVITKNPHQEYSPTLSPQEISNALSRCALMVQNIAYPKGPSTPSISSLNPYLDELGLLRVGGRLTNAPLPVSSRHPIILPTHSHFTKLLVDDIHQRHFHAGVNLTLCLLRANFWIPSGVRFIKGRIFKCVICRRRRAKPQEQIMAPLPRSRFDQVRPFLQVGIDFAGPFLIRDTLRRKPVVTKCYLSLFVCLSTKALHLEAVSSLTTEAFLATLDRFASRRGLPKTIHTDNATNFTGSARYLKDIQNFIKENCSTITSHLAAKSVDWKFIPPHSPNFGGLWEAGVKSVKNLLPTSVGSHPMTYEELSTIFIKIEALLNSRPLCPIVEDPDTLDLLTPGHFLIGSSLHALPCEDLSDVPTNTLSRWQLVHSRIQHVWDRWSKEYLNTLQQRHKWKKPGKPISVGDVVILLEKRNLLGQWPLARVTQTHPGQDGVVRVVTVRTSPGTEFKRSIASIAHIPLSSIDA